MSPTAPERRRLLWMGVLLLLVIGFGSYRLWQHYQAGTPPVRFVDQTGLIPPQQDAKFNQFLNGLHDEMGVDVRLMLVKSTGNQSLNDFAVDTMRNEGIGSHTGERGLLCVYDEQTERMRMEVGPGLEGIFTDAFVSYLERENLHAFAAAANLNMGLRLTLFMLDHRLREAALGMTYDPRPAQQVREKQQLAEGAGATETIGAHGPGSGFVNRQADAAVRARYLPQPTVQDAYNKYLQWLSEPYLYQDAPFLTSASQALLSHQTWPNAYFDYLLYQVYGYRYKIVVKGNLAMVYYTNTPFVSPWFFHRGPQGWQMDIAAAVHNSVELLGMPYTWSWRWTGDEYSKAFRPELVQEPDRVVRVIGGDNRALPLHISFDTTHPGH